MDTTREIEVVVEIRTACDVDVSNSPSQIELRLQNSGGERFDILLSRARTDTLSNNDVRRIDRYEGGARLSPDTYRPEFRRANFSGRLWTPESATRSAAYRDSAECAAGSRYLRAQGQRLNSINITMSPSSRRNEANVYILRNDQSLLVISAENLMDLPSGASLEVPTPVCDVSGCD